MATNYGNILPIRIPQLSDQANIVTALTQLYYGTLDGSTATESQVYNSTYSIAGNLQRLFTDKVNKAGNMTQFAQTTSASELRGLISGTTGTGNLVFASSPSISSPSISGGITLSGSTSGSLTIKPADTIATTVNIVFPATSGNVVTTGDSGTVTNTMLSGSIQNAKLLNSSITIGSSSVSLGGTLTTIVGLSSITSTSFVGALTGNASTATTLQTPRNINGIAFNGSEDIIVTAAAGTLTGTTLASNVTASSLTSVGTIATGVWNATAIAYSKLNLTGSIVDADIKSNAAIAVSKLANGTTGFILRAGSTGPEWVDTATVPVSSASKLVNAVTFNSSGSGASSPQSFDGSATLTVSHNTIGAAALSHTHGSITNDGKIGTTADLVLKTTTGGSVTTLAAGTTSQYLRGDGTWGTPAGTYSLPTATTSVLGGVKVDGTTITISSGTISSTQYTLPTASNTVLGGVKVDGTTVTINGSGVISAAPQYTLPTASTTVLGGIKIGSDTPQTATAASLGTTNGRTYLTQLDSNGRLVVNVPWTGTVTSVGLSVPAELTASAAITSSGTITIGYATGRSIPLTADVSNGVTAYGWGDHSLAGYLTSSSTLNATKLSGTATINTTGTSAGVTATGTSTGKTTFSNTVSGTFNQVGKIFVQQTTPANPVAGDLWFW